MPTDTPSARATVLRETAETLARSATPSGSRASELALISARLDQLTQTPPQPRTKDFDIAGREVPFPEQEASPETVLERLIDESDLLPIWFLEQGTIVQRAVARVVLTKAVTIGLDTFPPGTGWGTGFLVGSRLLLTNNHVIPDTTFAGKVKFQFNFQLGPDGGELITESYLPDAASLFHTDEALDFTLIRVRPGPTGGGAAAPIDPGQHWGFLPLQESPVLRKEQLVNVIQHPAGRRKEIALQNNKVMKLFENVIRYTTDTEPGSSGSPVFDNLWQLVALHHAGGDRDTDGKFLNNEGIRIDRIVENLRAKFAGTDVLTELGL